MLRPTLFALGAAALAATSAGQTRQNPAVATPVPIPSPVQYAGVYHVRTNTITRVNSAASNFGSADTIYSNTAESAFFSDLIGPTGARAGSQLTDSGGIPSTMNTYVTGVTRDTNTIKGFAFAYCDLDTTGAASGWNISFYDRLAPCASVVNVTPVASFPLIALPADGCWLLDVDLTGSEFCLGGDGGDGSFDDDPDLDSFGWGIQYIGSGTDAAGPLCAGDPSATEANYLNTNGPTTGVPAPAPTEGTATYYNPLSGCTSTFTVGGPREVGSGFFTQDIATVDDLTGTIPGPACFNFGGYFNLAGNCGAGGSGASRAFFSFYMELESDSVCSTTGNPVVSTPTACAPTNNTSGVPGTCVALGSAVAAQNNFTLRAANLPTAPVGVFGIFIHGNTDISATPIASGNGVLCIFPAGRLNLPNQIRQADAQGIAELSTITGDLDLTSLPTGGSPPLFSAMSGSTSYFGFWHRDFTVPIASSFNFTGTCAVTWQ